jgi:hypothetical protein
LAEDGGGRPTVPGFRDHLRGIEPDDEVCAPVDAFEPA